MKAYFRAITLSLSIKRCGEMNCVFGLVIAIVVCSSALNGGLYIHAMGYMRNRM